MGSRVKTESGLLGRKGRRCSSMTTSAGAFAENRIIRHRVSHSETRRPSCDRLRERNDHERERQRLAPVRRRARSHCNNHNTEPVNWAVLDKRELVNVVTSMNINELLRNIIEDPVTSAEGYKRWSLSEYVLQRKDRRIFVGGQGFVVFIRRRQHSSSLAMKVCLHNVSQHRIERYKLKAALQNKAARESRFVSDLLIYYVTENFFVSIMYKAKHASLKMLKREVGEFPANYIKYYAACIIDALNKLHRMNIAHKDVKADNILIDHLGVPQLADFGLAAENRRSRDAYTENRRVTSMQYYPPESLVIGGQMNDYKIDTWLYGFFLAEIIIPASSHMWTKFSNSISENWTFQFCAECGINNIQESLVKLMRSLLKQDPIARPFISQMIQHSYFNDVDWTTIENLPGDDLHIKTLINSRKGDDARS